MSRVKNKNTGWYSCKICNVYIHHQDIGKHSTICNEEKNNCDEEEILLKLLSGMQNTLKHAFIKNSCFYSFFQVTSTLISENLQLEDKIIKLPLQCMRLCGIRIGDLVLLKGKTGKKAVRIAQCSKDLESTCIEITEGIRRILSIDCDDYITIKPYRFDNKLYATKIILQPLKHCYLYSSKEFIEYLLKYENKNFYSAGCLLCLRFLGNFYEFFVRKIEGRNGNVISVESLCSSRTVFRIDESIDCSLISEQESLKLRNDSSIGDCLSEELQKLQLRCKSPDFNSTMLTQITKSSMPISSNSTQFLPLDIFHIKLLDAHRIEEENEQPFYYISSCETKLIIESHYHEQKIHSDFNSFEFVGGMDEKIYCLRKLVQDVLYHPQNLTNYIHIPFSALLFGPPGIGKTLIAKSIANEARCHFVIISAGDILRPYIGESDIALRNVFMDALERSPSIIFIDDIHEFFENSNDHQGIQESRIAYTFSDELDKLNKAKKPVFVLAATNKPELIPVRLRRIGRLSIEIEISRPSPKQRKQILEKLLFKKKYSLPEEDILTIAENTHGFFGGDLNVLCNSAFEIQFKNYKTQSNDRTFAKKGDHNSLEVISVTLQDFQSALHLVKPSGLREYAVEIPKVYWSDIGGQQEIKQLVYETIELPLKHPECFKRFKINPPSGILMYGPPGCSKTLIAKAVATESGINFISVACTELLSKWVGESERAVREVYRKARAAAPCIIFFDEIDALATGRGNSSYGGSKVGERLLGQLLTEIDGINSSQGVLTIAATNRPDTIDKALMRPGRLDYRIYVPLPDAFTRREIFSIKFQKMLIGTDVNMETLVEKTEKYSGAEIVAVCSAAFYCAVKEMGVHVKEINMSHFEKALNKVKPKTSDDVIKFYEDYQSIKT